MASELDTFAQAMVDPTVNGSPSFPYNRFHVRSVGQAASTPATLHGTVDPARNSAFYEFETFAHPDGRAVEIIRFMREYRVLDLSALVEKTPAEIMPAIGGFDLGGRNNTLKLSLFDAIYLGETDLFIRDGKLQLIVNGKKGDSITLSNSHIPGLADGDWFVRGIVSVGHVFYDVIEHSSANIELLVEPGVHIDMR